jgi:two-component system KDP operon response regulator KdpE
MVKLDTVLLVDDEPPIRRLLRTSLADCGYRIVAAEDAAGAMRVLATEKPDLMILDLGLPDKSGLELISEIRKTSAVPILVLSARHDERSKLRRSTSAPTTMSANPFAPSRHAPGKVLTHRHLLREVWGPAEPGVGYRLQLPLEQRA